MRGSPALWQCRLWGGPTPVDMPLDRAKWIACVYSERSVDWFSGPTWRAMGEKLFDAAADVAAKVGAN